MKIYSRRNVLGILGIGMLGLAGCTEDNETAANAVSKSAGDPGPINPNSKADTPPPPPKSQEEWMKSKGDPLKGSGYPGASKKKN